jgi:predicted ATPase
MARLDQLASAKTVAQLGATLGREFTYELLRAIAPMDELELWRSLVQLVRAEVLYQRGALPQATYLFKHALIQEAAYQSLLKSTRQQYHQRIAQVLAAQSPETTATQPELLAHHYTEAALAELAVGYWLQAGERSNARSAFMEAITYCTKGLAVLQTLPGTSARVQRELMLQLALDRALQTAKSLGAPERGQALTRVYELCQQVGDTPQLVTVLGSLASWHRERAEIYTAQEVAAQRLTLAQRQPDVTLLMEAHQGLAMELFFGGASLQPMITCNRPSPLPRANRTARALEASACRWSWCLLYPFSGASCGCWAIPTRP